LTRAFKGKSKHPGREYYRHCAFFWYKIELLGLTRK
jgi:hypothetical protein